MGQGEAAGWDQSVDLLVIGSGAGAMVTAIRAHDLGAQVLLVEKSPQYGGSSAMSGGGLWVPNNHLMRELGLEDNEQDALTYLRACTQGRVSEARLRAYLETAPEMVRYLCEKTRLELVAIREYPDYYPRLPGSRPGGRGLEPEAFDGRELGADLVRLREPAVQELMLGRISMTVREARLLLCRNPGWIRLTAVLMLRYWSDWPWRLRSRRDRRLAMGNALVGRLRRSLLDRGIPLWLEAPAKRLVESGGRVLGAEIERDGRRWRIEARRGVVLAAGGFEASQPKRERYLPHPTRAEWTCANPFNTGDAIDMALELGATLDLMDEAWWGPVTVVPGEARARMLVIEKSLPGSILVNRRGERFVNEALPYQDVVKAMYAKNSAETPSIPAYLIFDAAYRKRYPCGPYLPGAQQPDWAVPRRLREQHLRKAPTPEALAQRLGVDPRGLAATLERFNRFARAGKDEDFQRGETPIDRYYGDERVKPNPCLAPIETPPFYAIEAYPGELGTKGGLRTDEHARVLREDGRPIPGLYAIGNCSASVMGPSYPGPGATLGPATTFGFRAAEHAMAS